METLTFENLVKEKFNSLSAGQKKVAEYLLQNLEEAVFSTAFQIGRKVDVSETTVIRLSYALGLGGFSDMQEKIKRQLLSNNQQPPNFNNSANSNDKNDKNAPFSKVIENEINILRSMLQQLNMKDLWKAVDTLINADRILIVGFRASYAAAHWFSYTLSTLREGVSLCPSTDEFHEKFCDLTEQSAVLLISFPRYTKESLHIAKCTKKQGVQLISVTDRMLSPVGRISDITLTTEENAESGSNSISSIISLLDLVITGINAKDKARIQSRQKKLEELYSGYEVFIE
ncbi:MurR/RpiR family transcriptional regulator [Scopulibacillus cellulosilyticus]|uniref:MurR/RpiR family transcriptional regulator n=2 Tax=Scopulibacillus cellulosilyticus TaxID=2665665 RepID=A0ABW2Q3Z0_9BACL